MISLSTYLTSRQNSKNLPIPQTVQHSVCELFRDANKAILKDMKQEDVTAYHLIKNGENFKIFYAQNKKNFEALGCFLFDHQGLYDKDRQLYNWTNVYPVASAIFMFNLKMPYRSRLIDLTRRYDFAYFAMDDPEVCRFVVQNFSVYASIKDMFLDEHGRAQTILERLYTRLHSLNYQRPFEKASPQWCLMNLIYQYIYAEHKA